jgi:hypothetical protein
MMPAAQRQNALGKPPISLLHNGRILSGSNARDADQHHVAGRSRIEKRGKFTVVG